jgi:predicted RNA methylase
MEEYRRFSRIPFSATAHLKTQRAESAAPEIIDLGAGGCRLALAGDFEPGEACELRIELSGTSSRLAIAVHGEIVRRDAGGVAVRFTRIDPDSLFHLKNIVRYNAADVEKVEEEFGRHPGLF